MKKRLGNYMQEYAVGLFTILLFVFCMIFVPNFSSAKNLVNISTQISINGLIATGMTFVILTGGIDLSVGLCGGGVLHCCGGHCVENAQSNGFQLHSDLSPGVAGDGHGVRSVYRRFRQ